MKAMMNDLKLVGKVLLAIGGVLYPLTELIYLFKNSGFHQDTALLGTLWLLALLVYAIVPFTIQSLKWDVLWSTIFSIIGIFFLIIASYNVYQNKTTVNYFIIIFVVILVLGALLWMIKAMIDYFRSNSTTR